MNIRKPTDYVTMFTTLDTLMAAQLPQMELYTVMSNHHLRNKVLSLKAKGLLSQMLSLPEDWDYTLKGLSLINREQIDAIRAAIRELEQAGYIVRSRERDSQGRLRGADYVIYEQPQPVPDSPTLENPMLDSPAPFSALT